MLCRARLSARNTALRKQGRRDRSKVLQQRSGLLKQTVLQDRTWDHPSSIFLQAHPALQGMLHRPPGNLSCRDQLQQHRLQVLTEVRQRVSWSWNCFLHMH